MFHLLSKQHEDETQNDINSDNNTEPEYDIESAIEQYRKVREYDKDLTEEEIAEIDKECEIIRKREIITKDLEYEPKEILNDTTIVIGSPTLTRSNTNCC